MMVDLYKNFDHPMSHQGLFLWHKMLMNGRYDLKSLGSYRVYDETMRVVSGPIDNPKIHFEAPPSSQTLAEMEQFITWFNASNPQGNKPLPALIRSGIAHLHFACIHPFEHGNGRIGRAISEKALAQNLGHPSLIALAYTIEKSRNDYYKSLEQNNKHNEITDWLLYFANMILNAQENTKKLSYIARCKTGLISVKKRYLIVFFAQALMALKMD